VRTILVKKDMLPNVGEKEFYGFNS